MVLAFAVGGAALTTLILGLTTWIHQLRQPQATALTSLTLPLSLVQLQAESLAAITWATAADIPVGSFWQTGNAAPSQPQPLQLSQRPTSAPGAEATVDPPAGPPSLVPVGSILKVVSRQTSVDNIIWVRLQVCAIPSGASLDQVPQETDGTVPSAATAPDLNRRLSPPGQLGWVPERTLYRSATLLPQPNPTQSGACSP
jgi:hypothetical protein